MLILCFGCLGGKKKIDFRFQAVKLASSMARTVEYCVLPLCPGPDGFGPRQCLA